MPNYAPRTTVGGRVPDEWTLYPRCSQIAWLAKFSHDAPLSSCTRSTTVARVLGFCPVKVPLGPPFSRMLEQRRRAGDIFCAEFIPSTVVRVLNKTSLRSLPDDPYDEFDNEIHNPDYKAPVKLNIVSIINLCLTDRYYDKGEFGNQCSYAKIPLAGQGTQPNDEDYKALIRTVRNCFDSKSVMVELKRDHDGSWRIDWTSPSNAGKNIPLMLIHCTHGLNRTGLAFSYVADAWLRGEMMVDSINDLFTMTRGHKMEREELLNYLDIEHAEIRRRANMGQDVFAMANTGRGFTGHRAIFLNGGYMATHVNESFIKARDQNIQQQPRYHEYPEDYE